MTLNCECGEVRIEVAKRPDFIHECNCSLCTKAAARWGYFHPDEVDIRGSTSGFRRTDKTTTFAEVHACLTCGTTTHFVMTEDAITQHGNTMMGINMWLGDPSDLAGVEVRYPDGLAWSGQGDWDYVREATIL